MRIVHGTDFRAAVRTENALSVDAKICELTAVDRIVTNADPSKEEEFEAILNESANLVIV